MRLIESQITVADIMDRWPETIPVFLKHGAYCVGCEMASFETLEEVIGVFNLTLEGFEEELEQIIAQEEQKRGRDALR